MERMTSEEYRKMMNLPEPKEPQTVSVDEYHALLKKAEKSDKKSKMHNEYCERHGIRFQSIHEANRYDELLLLTRAGVIKDLRRQVKYLLREGFVKNGRRIREISYYADFVYVENGRTIVEDAKGYPTPMYKLKRKLFEDRYPDLTITEV